MGAIYRISERFAGREWLSKESVRYVKSRVPVHSRKVPVPSVLIAPLPTSVVDQAEARFKNLTEQWESDTRHISSVSQIILHPAYQQIIGMGPIALPFILARLTQEAHHWFWALQSITGENPVPPDAVGNMPRMRDVWLKWARDHGFLA
jgi:hypothetical protein